MYEEEGGNKWRSKYLSVLHVTLLDDLLDDFFLIRGAELGLEGLVGGAVEGALLALPVVREGMLVFSSFVRFHVDRCR